MPTTETTVQDKLRLWSISIFSVLLLVVILYPLGTGQKLTQSHFAVAFLSACGIVITVLSERVVNLVWSWKSLKLKLENIKRDIKGSSESLRADIGKSSSDIERSAELQQQLGKVEDLVKNDVGDGDLKREAKNIGEAMSLLGSIMEEYRRAQKR